MKGWVHRNGPQQGELSALSTLARFCIAPGAQGFQIEMDHLIGAPIAEERASQRWAEEAVSRGAEVRRHGPAGDSRMEEPR
jgi:hypothetical protein